MWCEACFGGELKPHHHFSRFMLNEVILVRGAGGDQQYSILFSFCRADARLLLVCWD